MRIYLSITIVLLSALLSFHLTGQEKVNYFSNDAFGNPVVGNTGEYYKGVTYIAYQGDKEDPYVVAYDHKNDKWVGPYKAGTSLLGKTPGKKIDNHGKPTLVVDGEGYIHLVFGGHGGSPDLGENTLGNYNGGKQIHVKTKKPMDISSWEEVDNISPFGTYSQFLKMDNGDIYLIYRHGAHRSNWVYQVSKDNCHTFSPEVSFLKAKQAGPNEKSSNAYDSWYINLEKGSENEIVVSYNYHLCYGIGKVHYGERHNCYFMRFDTDKKEWYNVKGERLQLPITKEYADTMTLAVSTGDRWNHLGRVALNNQNHPHVCWYEGEDNGSNHGGPKQLVNYYWTGNEWVGGSTNLPIEARGEVKVSSHDSIRYLLGNMKGKTGEVAWWHSCDGGKEFTKEDVWIQEAGGKFTTSHFIRNAHPEARIVVTQKIEGTDYSRIYLLGDKGAVMRPKVEADVLTFDKNTDFELINKSKKWNLVLDDKCTDDWTKNWTLDGLMATVENTIEGMHFKAGSEEKNDAHHAVLWTKESFAGDIKVEYDYTRTDTAIKYVTLLYIQATGDEEGEFTKDIREWSKFREVPAMRKYFENMNLLHISYAAFGNDGDGFYYVRSRRYPKPKDKGFNTIQLEPSYDYKGFMKTGQKYHVTAIKSDNMLYFKIESAEGEELFTWDLSKVAPVTEGRIGLRHMYTRSAIYKSFKVYTIR